MSSETPEDPDEPVITEELPPPAQDPKLARLIAIAFSLISLPAMVLAVFFLIRGCQAS